MTDAMKFDLPNAKKLAADLKKFPVQVRDMARQRGLANASKQLVKALRNHAPTGSGTLKKALGSKKMRSGAYKVGINAKVQSKDGKRRVPVYYETLGLEWKYEGIGGKPPKAPWFEDAVNREIKFTIKNIISETNKALYTEAGKFYAKHNYRHKGKR